MKSKKTVIWFVLVCVVFAFANTAHASEFRWRYFGAAPYATSRTLAMETRKSAFSKLGLPSEVVALFMERTRTRGRTVRIVNGDRLSAMISRGGVVHRNVLVDFISPLGSGKMEYAAPAERWSVTWKGRVYTLFLPEVCNNWSVRVSTKKVHTVAKDCVLVTFRVIPGDIVRYAVFTDGSRLSSSCWSLSDGNITSATPSPCTVCDWSGPLQVLPEGSLVKYSGLYRARNRVQTLRFPRGVMQRYVALCVTRAGLGESDSWVIQPSAWGSDVSLKIPYSGQKWPVWGISKIDWSRWKH